jgi:hypothetical protein
MEKDPETITNVFNNFFLTITESLNLHKWEKKMLFNF